MTDDGQVLHGGEVNPFVMRVCDTVRRTTSAATPAVHALLAHLESKGFDGAPRALGFDDHGREVLTYIEGEVSLDGSWPQVLREDEGLVAVVELLRRFHDAAADYTPDGVRPGQIVCHGDPGPWNIVWRDVEPVAFIDWDFAKPASPLYDLSYVAFEMVPLRDDERCREVGFTEIPDRARRLRLVCDTYGRDATPAALIDLAAQHQQADIEEIEDLGPQGIEPERSFLEQGLHLEARAMLDWLRVHRDALLA